MLFAKFSIYRFSICQIWEKNHKTGCHEDTQDIYKENGLKKKAQSIILKIFFFQQLVGDFWEPLLLDLKVLSPRDFCQAMGFLNIGLK
jgi:hypothetical protein